MRGACNRVFSLATMYMYFFCFCFFCFPIYSLLWRAICERLNYTILCPVPSLSPDMCFLWQLLGGCPKGPWSTGGTEISGIESVIMVWWSRGMSFSYLPALLFLPSSTISGRSPKVLWKQPVSAMYLKSTHSVFSDVNSFATSMFLPPVLFHRVCLAAWWAGQCSMKWCIVSSLCRHAGQIGEFVLPMQWRCLARGVCPILSWDRMLASFLGSSVTKLMYLLEGVVGSVSFILLKCLDFCQFFCMRCLSFS